MKPIRKESEIISHWKGNILKPLVSICCTTYNHEIYIEDALISFLDQETDFPFEILVHDDASTDGTADIVRQYAKRYPNLIKAIYQSENQYSKGIRVGVTLNLPRAKGEFIAFCEGDDYWTDSKKLQVQVSALINQPELSGCFHKVNYLVDNEFRGFYYEVPRKDTLNSNDIIINHYMPTAATMYRKDAIIEAFKENSLIHVFPVGDIPLSILASQKGPILFINVLMGVYRKNPTSVTHDPYQKGLETSKAMILMYVKMLSLVKPKNYISLFYVIARRCASFIKLKARN
jgi:glycosyltransferase involved in cell wall biosynthesis